jgi:hypothetical protein
MFDDFDTQIQCEEVYMDRDVNIVYYDPEFVIERVTPMIHKITWDNGKMVTVNDSLEEAIFCGESFRLWD